MIWEPDGGEVRIEEENLPGCCSAVNVLSNAEYEDKEGFKKALKCLIDGEGDLDAAGMLLYTLSDSQTEDAEVLIECGFEALKRFQNPHTHNNLTLYGKVLVQPTGRAPRARVVTGRVTARRRSR